MLRLSIITINLNNAAGLQKTIHSIINQTFHDFEFIVIDGGSSDGSIELIKKHSNKINYWISEPDNGIYNAMNKGILKANGEYLLFLNSGDWLHNENVLKEAFDNEFIEDIVYGHQLKEQDGKLIEDICLDLYYYSFNTLKRSHIPHQSTFLKRSLFIEKVGTYDENYKIISDWAFIMLSIFKFDCSIRRIDTFISVYDTNGISSIEEFKKLQFTERAHFLNKYFHLFMIDYDSVEAFMNKPYMKAILKMRNTVNRLLKRGNAY